MNEGTTAISLNSSKTQTTVEVPAAIRCIGIRALMLAVLEDAIHCLRSSHSLVRTKAELWITSKERRHVFSFVMICETLGLEPSAVSRSVMGLPDDKRTDDRFLKRLRPNGRQSGSIQVWKGGRPTVGRGFGHASGQRLASRAVAVA